MIALFPIPLKEKEEVGEQDFNSSWENCWGYRYLCLLPSDKDLTSCDWWNEILFLHSLKATETSTKTNSSLVCSSAVSAGLLVPCCSLSCLFNLKCLVPPAHSSSHLRIVQKEREGWVAWLQFCSLESSCQSSALRFTGETGCSGLSFALVGCQSPIKADKTVAEAGFNVIKHKSLALTRQEEQPSGIHCYL